MTSYIILSFKFHQTANFCPFGKIVFVTLKLFALYNTEYGYLTIWSWHMCGMFQKSKKRYSRNIT